jgi:hypothetical protein
VYFIVILLVARFGSGASAAEVIGSVTEIDLLARCDNPDDQQMIYAQCEAITLIPRAWLQTRGDCHHIPWDVWTICQLSPG